MELKLTLFGCVRRIAFFAATMLLFCTTALAHPGVGIVMDARGNLFYTDLEKVWMVDAQGRASVAVPNVHTHELYIDRDGNLFGEHLWYAGPQDGSGKWFHRVWKRSPDGRIADVEPTREGFPNDHSFVRDPARNQYIAGIGAERERVVIRRIAPDGTTALLAGSTSGFADGRGAAARFANIRWMAFGDDGNLYLIDDGHLRKVALDGTVTTIVREIAKGRRMTGADKQHFFMGLSADARGVVYLASFGSGAVLRIQPDGQITTVLKASLPFLPSGVRKAGEDLYVLETATYLVRVRKLTGDGRVSVIAGGEASRSEIAGAWAVFLVSEYLLWIVILMVIASGAAIFLFIRRFYSHRKAVPVAPSRGA